MAPRTVRLLTCLAGAVLLTAPAAHAAGAGGLEADPGALDAPSATAGGAEYGSSLPVLPGRPVVRTLRLAESSVVVGSNPRLVLRITRPRAETARLRVVADPARGRSVTSAVRTVRADDTVSLRLPRTLARGRWKVHVLVYGSDGERPVVSGSVTLQVTAKPKTPLPDTGEDAPPTPVPETLGGTPPASVAGTFPVQGAWSFGGTDARFGAGRTGHTHEGQDIAAAEGTPVVAPLAGEVLFNDYQAGGAGRYVVFHADNGWDMFFAHCQAGSATVKPGTRVDAGGQLCNVGSTGGSSGPHLHFEIWPDGWRHLKGTRPVDPLPQLKVWAGQ